jgi:predicted nucleic acid-binding protein
MRRLAIRDTGPLGLVTHPGSRPEVKECQRWLDTLLIAGVRVVIPAIADYELRRELIRANRQQGLARLDTLIAEFGLEPIDQDVVLEAARLWADVRSFGLPTAPELALDGDCILAAQANVLLRSSSQIEEGGAVQAIVATTNLKHLSRMTTARHWRDLEPQFD